MNSDSASSNQYLQEYHRINMKFIFLFGNDESIIQVDKDKVTEEVPEDIFNYAVEQYWFVGKSEKHHKIPRVPQVSAERCF